MKTTDQACWMNRALGAVLIVLMTGVATMAQEINESGLWYGPDEGVEIIKRTGVNLAFTEDSPKVHPQLIEHARRMDQAMLRVGDRGYVAYGWGLTSPVMLVGDDGVIIIDPPESLEVAEAILREFREITDKPVKAIVYTHSHFDHLAGVKAFASAEDVASGRVDIFAHEQFMQGVANWSSNLNPILGRRTSYTAAAFLDHGPTGSVNDAIGPRASVGTVTFIPPNKTFDESLDVEVAGLRMHLRHVPGETDNEALVWFPDLELLHFAEVIQGESFPNLHTLSGTKFRDPVRWFKSIDILRSYPAKFTVSCHGRPIVGAKNIQEMLTGYRDAIQYVHDQTVRSMNLGLTPDELVQVVQLPPHLANLPWNGEIYGTVNHAVRQIYTGYLGFFEADPWALDPLPPVERAAAYVKLMGGRDAILTAAREAVSEGKHTWAAEILTWVIRVDHDDLDARRLKGRAYRKWAAEQTSVNWRNWALTAANELEGYPLVCSFGFVSADVIAALPARKIVELMTTRLDAAKAMQVQLTMGIRLPDIGESYGLEIRRGVAQFHAEMPVNADFSLELDEAFLKRVLIGNEPFIGEMEVVQARELYAPRVSLLAGIKHGDVRVIGGEMDDVRKFLGYFDDPVDPDAIALTLR